MIQILLLTFCSYLIPAPPPEEPFDCNDLKVDVQITPSASGGMVKIKPNGGKRPYKIIFFKDTGQLVSDNFSKRDHRSLPTGMYGCVVIDGNNCKKTIDIQVP